jgi:hypothetical protein
MSDSMNFKRQNHFGRETRVATHTMSLLIVRVTKDN